MQVQLCNLLNKIIFVNFFFNLIFLSFLYSFLIFIYLGVANELHDTFSVKVTDWEKFNVLVRCFQDNRFRVKNAINHEAIAKHLVIFAPKAQNFLFLFRVMTGLQKMWVEELIHFLISLKILMTFGDG